MIVWDECGTKAAYDAVADTYADHFTMTEPEAALDLAVIDHFVGSLPSLKHTLDAGCGAGRLMPYLAARGCRVEGIDLSADMVRRAHRDHPGYPVSVASLAHLPYPAATFDGVFSWYSTIHSTDHELPVMFAEMARVLRPGGRLLVGFQTGSGVRDVSSAYRTQGHDITLMRYARSLAMMSQQLDRAGLAPVVTVEREPVAGERDGQGFVIARPQ